MMRFSFLKFLAFILALGLCIPERGMIPVQNATAKDWNAHSFWYYPWGKSGVHKGIDIFAKKDMPVVASTSGIVLFTGNISMGGNVVAVLGAKWRVHYYAHLAKINTATFRWVAAGESIGAVGDTGNAKGKPQHLHYAVISWIPYPWRYSNQIQGWKQIFYINPAEIFNPA